MIAIFVFLIVFVVLNTIRQERQRKRCVELQRLILAALRERTDLS